MQGKEGESQSWMRERSSMHPFFRIVTWRRPSVARTRRPRLVHHDGSEVRDQGRTLALPPSLLAARHAPPTRPTRTCCHTGTPTHTHTHPHTGERLQLLDGVSGALRPGVLTW